MKIKYFKKIILSVILVFAVALAFAEPGDPPGDPELGGNPPVGGNAPISGGLFVLLSAGLAYGGKKVYRLMRENEEEPLA
jgi:hypothetical protein